MNKRHSSAVNGFNRVGQRAMEYLNNSFSVLQNRAISSVTASLCAESAFPEVSDSALYLLKPNSCPITRVSDSPPDAMRFTSICRKKAVNHENDSDHKVA